MQYYHLLYLKALGSPAAGFLGYLQTYKRIKILREIREVSLENHSVGACGRLFYEKLPLKSRILN